MWPLVIEAFINLVHHETDIQTDHYDRWRELQAELIDRAFMDEAGVRWDD